MAETIGSLVDKISIIDLKIYHMKAQVERPDATEEHKERCRQRVAIMNTQLADLKQELSELSEAVLAGKRQLKVYRQFKMYNDPVYRKS